MARVGAAWAVLCICGAMAAAQASAPPVVFEPAPGQLTIRIAGTPVAVYVYDDPGIPRPYFAHVAGVEGTPLTRNHPPIEGADPTDHATYHPGVWMAFGDLGGADFWRNKARVVHKAFAEPSTGGPARGTFTVENEYRDGDRLVCTERCTYTVVAQAGGWFLIVEAAYTAPDAPVAFGDQEEMGFGVRVATPLMAKGGGTITNSAGAQNEAEVWGQQAAWCDYSAPASTGRRGVVLLTHPDNFRPSWFHARDYGLLLANPFGQNAFTEGEKSAVPIEPGTPFHLRFGLYLYDGAEGEPLLIGERAYETYLRLTGQP